MTECTDPVSHVLDPPESPNLQAGTNAGNCWMMGPFNGEFLAGNWQITMSQKCVTIGNAHSGRFNYRFWTAPTGSGEGASLITSTFFSSSILNMPANTTTVIAGTASVSLPNINLHNEYIFIHTQWSIITAGTNNNADNDYVFGTTASLVIPPSFVTHSKQQILSWNISDL